MSRTPSKEGKPAQPYTDEDRARLLAPITITHFGGKSHAGVSSAGYEHSFAKHQQGDRYGFSGDWPDLNSL